MASLFVAAIKILKMAAIFSDTQICLIFTQATCLILMSMPYDITNILHCQNHVLYHTHSPLPQNHVMSCTNWNLDHTVITTSY